MLIGSTFRKFQQYLYFTFLKNSLWIPPRWS